MIRLLFVCADCRTELEKLGATVDTSPRQMTAGRSCDVHPTSRHAQAMHAVHASLEVRERFHADNVETQPALDAAPIDPVVVAQLAATLVASSGEAFSEDLAIVSVANARTLLRVASQKERK